jgi:glutaredoxin 3
MKLLEIYTTPFCGFCTRAKILLNNKHINFTEINIGGDRDRRKVMKERSNGSNTVPQIFINGDHIGGCEDLYFLEQRGLLEKLFEN